VLHLGGAFVPQLAGARVFARLQNYSLPSLLLRVPAMWLLAGVVLTTYSVFLDFSHVTDHIAVGNEWDIA
jgi:hypothetical protein